VSLLPALEDVGELEYLRARLALLEEQMRVTAAHRMFERFHAFDAIKDDRCPACGGPVNVVETENSVTLRTKWTG